jgi:hypothetical protein
MERRNMIDEVTRKFTKCHWCLTVIGETDQIFRLANDVNHIVCTPCAYSYFKKQETIATAARYMIAFGVILLLWGIA